MVSKILKIECYAMLVPPLLKIPLRVLRVARFAARYHDYGFVIANETLELMTTISTSGELLTLSAERIWQEVQRSLSEDHPEVFFDVLRQCQALNVIWPDLEKLWGGFQIQQNGILKFAVVLIP